MKTKTFDCVKMKEECQRAVMKKYDGLPLEERRRKMVADILANPVLGEIYRRTFRPGEAGGKPEATAKVAEGGAEYGPKKAKARR